MLAATASAACSPDVNPLRETLVSARPASEPRSAPDFIERSRPARLDYLPVGAAASAGPRPPAPDKVKAAEAEMDAIRRANEARGEAARRAGAAVKAPAPVTD